LKAGGLLCLSRRRFSQAKAGLPHRSFSEGRFFDIYGKRQSPTHHAGDPQAFNPIHVNVKVNQGKSSQVKVG
jgi:hypothetical protein